MNKKLILKLCLMFWLVILLANSVLAFGIAPSSYNYDFVKGQGKELSLRILNSDHEDLTLFVYAENAVDSTKIIFNKQRLSVTPSDEEKAITFNVDLGDNPSPGLHEINIKVLQMPKTRNDISTNNLVDVVSVLVQKLNVFVPYEGSYLQGTLYAQGAEAGKPVQFINRVINKGSDDVISEGFILIKSAANQEITRIDLPPKKINPLEDIKLQASYSELKNPGLYIAETHLYYGEKELVLRDTFLVGEVTLEATSLSFGNFKLGEIIKLSFDVKNNWNQDIKSAYGDVSVVDKLGRVVSEFKTNNAYVSAHGLGRITGYWDTEDLIVGPYQLLLNLNYEGKTSKQIFDMVIGLDAVNVVSNDLSGNVLTSDVNDGPDKLSLLVILVVILLGINVFVIMRFMRKK